jgi:hypothetical protein
LGKAASVLAIAMEMPDLGRLDFLRISSHPDRPNLVQFGGQLSPTPEIHIGYLGAPRVDISMTD